MLQTLREKCEKSHKADRAFGSPVKCERQYRVSKSLISTPAAEQARQSLRLLEMERQLREMRRHLDLLTSIADPDDIKAALRLRQISPTITELKLWSSMSEAPAHLSEQQEERPW
jgi:hypothetical protein